MEAHGKVRAVATKDVGHALVRVQEEEEAHFIVVSSRGKSTLWSRTRSSKGSRMMRRRSNKRRMRG